MTERKQRPRRIVTSPAGRRRYLGLLAAHLAAQKGDFDEWHLWCNTGDSQDVRFMDDLAARHDWIKVVHAEGLDPARGSANIHRFFQGCAEPGTAYLRLDDDVVWLEPGFVGKMFAFREQNPQYFLVYANIVNNAVIAHLHDRAGRVSSASGRAAYTCMCPVGWKSPEYALDLHTAFLRSLRAGATDDWHSSFDRWELHGFERVSINAIAWLGEEFAAFGGVVGEDEEQWLAVDKPRQLNKMNCIFGGALCAHFAFFTQRDLLDRSGLLDRYAAAAPSGFVTDAHPPEFPEISGPGDRRV